jgi:signal peptidase II
MIWLFFSVIVAVVTADLITKFTIDGVMNSGIAWGLGAQLPWLWVFVVVFSFVLVAVLLWWFFSRKKRTWFWTIGLALFIGGVLGNAIDRLLSNGAVHDFIDFIIFRNNLADIALSVGAVMMVLAMIMEEFRAPR